MKRNTNQRQKARDARSGRYSAMKPCAECGSRAELWPEYEADGATMTGRDICGRCSAPPDDTARRMRAKADGLRAAQPAA